MTRREFLCAGLALMPGSAIAASPGDGRWLDLPTRTWVPRPLPELGEGPMPYGGKHCRMFHRSRTGEMVLTGGDYSVPEPAISHSGNQMVWAIDLGAGRRRWELLGPWCNGPVQPGRPDTVGWAYDARRDLGMVMPGFYFVTEQSTSACPAVTDEYGAFLFDFAGRGRWKKPPFGPPPQGYGGDTHASFAFADEMGDSVYRFRDASAGATAEILSLTTNKWSTGLLGVEEDFNRDQPAVDTEGRNAYVIGRKGRALLRFAIRSRRFDARVPLPSQWQPPVAGDMETYLAFDPINRVLLLLNVTSYQGFLQGLGVYHVDRKRWEWHPAPTNLEHPVRGNVVAFDPTHNCLVLIGGNGPRPAVFWLYRYR